MLTITIDGLTNADGTPRPAKTLKPTAEAIRTAALRMGYPLETPDPEVTKALQTKSIELIQFEMSHPEDLAGRKALVNEVQALQRRQQERVPNTFPPDLFVVQKLQQQILSLLIDEAEISRPIDEEAERKKVEAKAAALAAALESLG